MIYVDFSSCVKIWNKEKKYEFPYEKEIIITLFIDLNTLNLSYKLKELNWFFKNIIYDQKAHSSLLVYSTICSQFITLKRNMRAWHALELANDTEKQYNPHIRPLNVFHTHKNDKTVEIFTNFHETSIKIKKIRTQLLW